MHLTLRPANLEAKNEPDLPPWGWRQVLIGIGIAIVALVAIETIALPIATHWKTNSAPFLLVDEIGSLAFELALFGIAAAYTVGAYHGGWGLLGWRPRRPGAWLPWTGIALAVAYVALFAYIAVTQIPGLHWAQPQQNVPSDLFKHAQTIVPAILLTVVFAPICEESFFRGFIFNGLRRSLGTSNAAVASGLLFALAHFTPTLFVPFTVIGVGFAYAYRRTGTLYANVAAHATFNLISVLLTLSGGAFWLGHVVRF